jgi:hypothetical protein
MKIALPCHSCPPDAGVPNMAGVVCVCPAGPLPPSWGALTKLRECRMYTNTLSGPLPGSWSGMAALELLSLGSDGLTGGCWKGTRA